MKNLAKTQTSEIMSGKEIYRKLPKDKHKLMWKTFKKNSPKEIRFRFFEIINAIILITFCIWNLVDLFKFYTSGFKTLTLHRIPILGVVIFGISFILIASIHLKRFYKFIENFKEI